MEKKQKDVVRKMTWNGKFRSIGEIYNSLKCIGKNNQQDHIVTDNNGMFDFYLPSISRGGGGLTDLIKVLDVLKIKNN